MKNWYDNVSSMTLFISKISLLFTAKINFPGGVVNISFTITKIRQHYSDLSFTAAFWFINKKRFHKKPTMAYNLLVEILELRAEIQELKSQLASSQVRTDQLLINYFMQHFFSYLACFRKKRKTQRDICQMPTSNSTFRTNKLLF